MNAAHAVQAECINFTSASHHMPATLDSRNHPGREESHKGAGEKKIMPEELMRKATIPKIVAAERPLLLRKVTRVIFTLHCQ